jgi:hypothetical protein
MAHTAKKQKQKQKQKQKKELLQASGAGGQEKDKQAVLRYSTYIKPYGSNSGGWSLHSWRVELKMNKKNPWNHRDGTQHFPSRL